jgi:hypothetical protein
MTLLTDFSVTLTNPTPEATTGGAIVANVVATISGISSSNNLGSGGVYIYSYFDLTSTCTLATNVLTWGIRSQLAQSAIVTCRAKITYNSSANTSFGLSSIYSERASGEDIDKLDPVQSAGATLDNTSNGSALLLNLSFLQEDDAAGGTDAKVAGANAGGTNHFKWEF